jgi:hypothetical protein
VIVTAPGSKGVGLHLRRGRTETIEAFKEEAGGSIQCRNFAVLDKIEISAILSPVNL